MNETSRLHVLAFPLALCAALQVGVESIQAQGDKAKTKKPTVEVPKVDVTASEGSTATAQRGRPAHPLAAAKTVNAALKAALARPAVSGAVRAEVLRQLGLNRPVAFADGYWVSAIKVASIYQLPQVRPQLLAALGADGPELIGAASAGPEGIIVAFTPGKLGRLIMGDLTRDLTGSFGPGGLENQMTDVTADNVIFSVSYGLGGLATGSLIDFVRYLMNKDSGAGTPSNNTGDLDGDGIPDSEDTDDDGDGWPDEGDHYPRDSSKHICDCGRPAVFFDTAAGPDLLPALLSGLSAARAQLPSAISLGSVVSGQSGSLALVF